MLFLFKNQYIYLKMIYIKKNNNNCIKGQCSSKIKNAMLIIIGSASGLAAYVCIKYEVQKCNCYFVYNI